MLKWIFRLLTIASVAAAIGLPFYFEAGLGNAFNRSDSPALSVTPHNGAGSVTKVYKWRDSSGTWQYSDQAPETATDIQVIDINPATNLLQSTQAVEAAEPDTGILPVLDPRSRRIAPAIPDLQQSGFSDIPGGSALRKAEEARALLEARKAHIDEAVEQ